MVLGRRKPFICLLPSGSIWLRMFYHDLLLPKISEGLLCLFGGESWWSCVSCVAQHVGTAGRSTSQDATGKVHPESQCIGDDTLPALGGRGGDWLVHVSAIQSCHNMPNLSKMRHYQTKHPLHLMYKDAWLSRTLVLFFLYSCGRAERSMDSI